MASYTAAIETHGADDGSGPSRTADVEAVPLDTASRPARLLDTVSHALDASSRPDRAPAAIEDHARELSVKVPAGYYGVDVVLRDAVTEERMGGVQYVTTPGRLGIISSVDEKGEGVVYLRPSDYTEFLALAERDATPEGVDYTWYVDADRQDPINPLHHDEATIWLRSTTLTGMHAGNGFNSGGPLG
jgi:hypothetical protein